MLPRCRYPHPLFAIPSHIPKPHTCIANPKPKNMLVAVPIMANSSVDSHASFLPFGEGDKVYDVQGAFLDDGHGIDTQSFEGGLIKAHGRCHPPSHSSTETSSPSSSLPPPTSPVTPSTTGAKSMAIGAKAAVATSPQPSPSPTPSSPLFVSQALLAKAAITPRGDPSSCLSNGEEQKQHTSSHTSSINNEAVSTKSKSPYKKSDLIATSTSSLLKSTYTRSNAKSGSASRPAPSGSTFRMALLKTTSSTKEPILSPASSLVQPKESSSTSSSLSQETTGPISPPVARDKSSAPDTCDTGYLATSTELGSDNDMKIEREISFTHKGEQQGPADVSRTIAASTSSHAGINATSSHFSTSPSSSSLFDLSHSDHRIQSPLFESGLIPSNESSLPMSSFSSASLPIPLLHSSSWSSLDPVLSPQSPSLYNSLSQQQHHQNNSAFFPSAPSLPAPLSSFRCSAGFVSITPPAMSPSRAVVNGNDAEIAALFAQSLSTGRGGQSDQNNGTTSSDILLTLDRSHHQHQRNPASKATSLSPVMQSIASILLEADLLHPAFYHALITSNFLPDGHEHFHLANRSTSNAFTRQQAWNSAVDEYKLLQGLSAQSSSGLPPVDDVDIAAKISIHGGAMYARCAECKAPLPLEEMARHSISEQKNIGCAEGLQNDDASQRSDVSTGSHYYSLHCPSCNAVLQKSDMTPKPLLSSQYALRIALELVLMRGMVDKHVLQCIVKERVEKYCELEESPGSDLVNSVAASIINDLDQ